MGKVAQQRSDLYRLDGARRRVDTRDHWFGTGDELAGEFDAAARQTGSFQSFESPAWREDYDRAGKNQACNDAGKPEGRVMALGPYASFIVTAYSLVALVLVLLSGWIVVDYRNQTRRLRALEESGVVRRSGRSAMEL